MVPAFISKKVNFRQGSEAAFTLCFKRILALFPCLDDATLFSCTAHSNGLWTATIG